MQKRPLIALSAALSLLAACAKESPENFKQVAESQAETVAHDMVNRNRARSPEEIGKARVIAGYTTSATITTPAGSETQAEIKYAFNVPLPVPGPDSILCEHVMVTPSTSAARIKTTFSSTAYKGPEIEGVEATGNCFYERTKQYLREPTQTDRFLPSDPPAFLRVIHP